VSRAGARRIPGGFFNSLKNRRAQHDASPTKVGILFFNSLKKYKPGTLFKQVVDLMNRKEHLTLEGLKKVVSLKASINNGLSEEQKAAFSDLVPVHRPLVVDKEIKDPQ
jgi:hypothetical protein